MRMLERLLAIVRIEICEQFDGADIVNVCEAMPNMKSALKCLTVRDILRYYVRHMGGWTHHSVVCCSVLSQ